jgi:molecular chaperone GrpE (heat shock protein)
MNIITSLLGSDSATSEQMRDLAHQCKIEAQELLKRANELDNQTNTPIKTEEDFEIRGRAQPQILPDETPIHRNDIMENTLEVNDEHKIAYQNICSSLAQFSVEVKLTHSIIEDLSRRDTIIRDLHDELQEHKSGIKKAITLPILKCIIRWYDRLKDLNTFYEEKIKATTEIDDSSDASLLLNKVLKEYANLSYYILDLMYDYDLEPIVVNIGDVYTPKYHRALSIVETTEELQNNTIAEIKRIGFEDVVLNRVIRHCEVIVYKLK